MHKDTTILEAFAELKSATLAERDATIAEERAYFKHRELAALTAQSKERLSVASKKFADLASADLPSIAPSAAVAS